MNAVPPFVKRLELAKAKRQRPETIDNQVRRRTLPPFDVTRQGSYGWCRETLEAFDPGLIKVLAVYFADLRTQG